MGANGCKAESTPGGTVFDTPGTALGLASNSIAQPWGWRGVAAMGLLTEVPAAGGGGTGSRSTAMAVGATLPPVKVSSFPELFGLITCKTALLAKGPNPWSAMTTWSGRSTVAGSG